MIPNRKGLSLIYDKMLRPTSIIVLFVLLFLSCNPITERMDGYEVHGIDISHYQSVIQWDSIAAQHIHFAFAKATEGVSLQDKHYCNNWKEMERVGLKKGAYHFFRPGVPALEQMQNFAEQVDLKPGDLPPVLDVEVMDGVDQEALIENVREWLLLAEVQYQVRPILYSNYNFYRENLAGAFPEYPVWIARYSDRKPYLSRSKQWDFWQYGDNGRLNGIDGDVDLNVFNGSLEELEKMCIASPKVFTYHFSSAF